MYCSNCGNSVREGLKYCNQCGGKMQADESPLNESVAGRLSISLGFIGFAGFGALIGLVAILLSKESLDPAAIVMVVLFYLLALSGICFLILRQISKLAETSKKADENTTHLHQPKELKSPQPNQLNEPTQPPASVVENTTRTLDKVPVERK